MTERIKALTLRFDNDWLRFFAARGKTVVGLEAHSASEAALLSTRISRRNAKILRDWLTKYLAVTDTRNPE